MIASAVGVALILLDQWGGGMHSQGGTVIFARIQNSLFGEDWDACAGFLLARIRLRLGALFGLL